MTKRIERLRLRSVKRVGNAKWGAVHALLSVAGGEFVDTASSAVAPVSGRGKTSESKKLIGNARAARKAAKRRPVAMAGR